ncbi:probable translation initiation factor IF-2 1 [Methanoculleus sp. CAG:1088]|jgi:translation initiation factor 5B|uniref:translation initiation factor IF-2 n=1 Tax=Methanomethylophilus alvi TaxID=1291540 RepID=UPI00033B6494|nr:translation initiation factor IF-2 [Methanomethylophilus alvi]MDD7479734.1 translation initiation factor IF-2 [Methanomethylophilus alvi]MDY7060134.1 translation initiation factor IF-2 [Methanomethylophilus alvi]CDF31009.1 probable translation initiation factor IF-2 1 [Methanoculleus sp. CAG:1088]
MAIRQPVVSVLGHVDHGKTKLLDRIRGTAVGDREAGAITQHIGATEVPIGRIYEMCGSIIGSKKFTVPGLLFIDTPGHQAFTSLRARGGSLADLAVLVIDIREGLMPQTIESIHILRQYKTPFVIALNKVDTIEGWNSTADRPFVLSEKDQQAHTKEVFEQHMYEIISQLSSNGVFADRYDRIDDFTKAVALIPISAKTGEGVPDLMLMLIGLAQRFLETRLTKEEGPGKGTVLEVKEVKGLGQTLDMILYSGTLKTGATVAIGTRGAPLVTRIKAILKPKPLDEIRDPRDRFDNVKELHAAAGVKIAVQDATGVIAGAPIRVVKNAKDPSIQEITEETSIKIETEEKGITIKADAIGSLEALAYEAKAAGIPIRKYGIGEITRRDVLESSYGNDTHHVILGFNVSTSKDAEAEIATHSIKVMTNNIVYALIDDYKLWLDESTRQNESDKRVEFAFPAKITILPDHIFRVNKPAVVGVRVLAGRIRVGENLIDREGKDCGTIKSVRDDDGNVLKEGVQGDEVSVAIEGVTVGRQINENDVLYVDMIESGYKEVQKVELTDDEKLALSDTVAIKRRTEPFWGM